MMFLAVQCFLFYYILSQSIRLSFQLKLIILSKKIIFLMFVRLIQRLPLSHEKSLLLL